MTDPEGIQTTIFTVADTLIGAWAVFDYSQSYNISTASPAGNYYFRAYVFPQGIPVAEDFDVFLVKKSDGSSPLTVTLTPLNPPIIIPANGGSFSFNIEGSNTGAIAETFDLWTTATLPGGSVYGPIINVPDLTLGAGASIDRDRTQSVPAAAPAGNYIYDACIGNYPDEILAQDHFEFTKSASSDRGGFITGWENTGDEFNLSGSEISGDIPRNFTIEAYPNPFNPETNISFFLTESSDIQLTVYDVQGREVMVLSEGFQTAGAHQVTMNASQLPSGVYFAALTAGSNQAVKKLLLVK